MIHLPTGSDFGDQEYFYDNILGFKNFTLDDFDVQGVSFYPFYGIFHFLYIYFIILLFYFF